MKMVCLVVTVLLSTYAPLSHSFGPGNIRDISTSDDSAGDLGFGRRSQSFTRTRYFNAEPGHVYSLSGDDEACMRLLDVTSEETIVACEPYHQGTTD